MDLSNVRAQKEGVDAELDLLVDSFLFPFVYLSLVLKREGGGKKRKVGRGSLQRSGRNFHNMASRRLSGAWGEFIHIPADNSTYRCLEHRNIG